MGAGSCTAAPLVADTLRVYVCAYFSFGGCGRHLGMQDSGKRRKRPWHDIGRGEVHADTTEQLEEQEDRSMVAWNSQVEVIALRARAKLRVVCFVADAVGVPSS